MKINIPYFAQSKKYTCGPAAVRMLLAHHGKECSEEELMEQAQTCAKKGTDNELLKKAVERFGMMAQVFEHMTIEKLQELVGSGKPVLVNYRNLKDQRGHFAVVVGADENMVVVQDPEFGEGFRIPQDIFLDHWISGDEKHPQWGLVIESS